MKNKLKIEIIVGTIVLVGLVGLLFHTAELPYAYLDTVEEEPVGISPPISEVVLTTPTKKGYRLDPLVVEYKSDLYVADVAVSGFRPVFDSERECLILNSIHEARGESFTGQVAITYSVLNRYYSSSAKSYSVSGHLCDIIFHPKAYSWTIGHNRATGSKTSKAWVASEKAVDFALINYSPTNDIIGDSTHYFAFKKVTPFWRDHHELFGRIGNHEYSKRRNETIKR